MRYYNMNYRDFRTQLSLTRQEYHCAFVYLQTAISLRHSDTVDVKCRRQRHGCSGGAAAHRMGRVSKKTGLALTDARAAEVAAGILKEALERGDDIELLDLNPAADEVVKRAA